MSNSEETEKQDENSLQLTYNIAQNPPWGLSIFLGLQHYLAMFGGVLSVPLLLAPMMCVNDPVVTGELINTIFFMSGIATLMQTCLGNRLPIVQGSTFSYIVPTFALLSLPQFQCPVGFKENPTNSTFNGIWKIRMREIQGAVMVSSLVQMIIGFTGLIGFLLRFIGPITIAPTITLIGLSLFPVSSSYAGAHWGVAALTIIILVICSQLLVDVKVPLPAYSKSKGLHKIRVAIFSLFPVLFAVAGGWILSAILTSTGSILPGSRARTDLRSSVLSKSLWFRVPYPGQWGTPTVSIAGVFGMCAGVIAGILESIGDYFACARLSGAPTPPSHAMNRGIAVEGVACFLAGAVGTGNATTSFSQNIGVIGTTKVGSRRVVQVGALLTIALALVGKFGAIFSTIPDPVIGGVFCCMFGLITAVGISNLQYVSLNSVRNLFIVGFSIIMGMVIPDYLRKNPGAIEIGVTEINQVISVLLSTSMAIGGLIAFTLDNIIPGTAEERGIRKWRDLGSESSKASNVASIHVYDLPFGFANKWKISKYLPFLPHYDEENNFDIPAENTVNMVDLMKE